MKKIIMVALLSLPTVSNAYCVKDGVVYETGELYKPDKIECQADGRWGWPRSYCYFRGKWYIKGETIYNLEGDVVAVCYLK